MFIRTHCGQKSASYNVFIGIIGQRQTVGKLWPKLPEKSKLLGSRVFGLNIYSNQTPLTGKNKRGLFVVSEVESFEKAE